MRWPRRTLESAPPPLVVACLVVLQLAVAAALGHGQGWHHTSGGLVIAACLLALQVTLIYAVMNLVGGRAAALIAGLVFVLAPVVLAKRYFVTGGPNLDYRTVYRHDILPVEYGLQHRGELVAACLILASAYLSLVRTRVPLWATAALAGAAGSAAALVYPHAWLVLAAPVLAALALRRPLPAAAALTTVGIGLIALAVFRQIPHVTFGWHSMGITLGGVREFTWSRRVLEYLPIAGFIGLARRSTQGAAFFGAALVALVILPLSQQHDVTVYLLSIVPGLPAYWLFASSIGFLVPRGRAVSHANAAGSAAS
jgi:hypothetical protein